MKKLNNKGFTLVELLAVIIILAIVVGISIPAITNVINDSKNNALGVAVDAAEKFMSDQYAFMQISTSNVQNDFKTWITGAKTSSAGGTSHTVPLYTSSTTSYTHTMTTAKVPGLIEAMGFNKEDVTQIYVSLNENGSVCVEVKSIPADSQYYSTEHWSGTTPKASAKVKSKGC